MKNKAPCLLLLFAFTIAKAQTTFQPSVIASSGSYAAYSGGSMQWTLGEVVTETATTGSHSFTQGFNQPDTSAVPTGIHEVSPMFTVSSYPNPITDNLFIDLKTKGQYTVSVYTIEGKKLNEYSVTSGSEPIIIPFGNYTDGVYMVSITNQTTQKSSFKVIKSN